LFLRGISLAKIVKMRAANAAGDPSVVVVISQQDIARELFIGLEVGCLSLGSAEMKNGSTKSFFAVVFDIAQ
jgi:hypothetical protein